MQGKNVSDRFSAERFPTMLGVASAIAIAFA
jgi:hypothetical protein